MLAAISSLIGLLIFVAIAVLSSLLKRKEEEPFELPPELKPRRDRSQPSSTPRRWEDELRRVLENRPAPPPLVHRMPAPPSPRVPPPIYDQPGDEGGIEVDLPAPRPRIEPVFQNLPGLRESDERMAGAASLKERVASRMAEVTRHPVGTTLVTRAAATMEATDAMQLLRARRGLQTALIASLILGPPRALEG